MPMPSWPRSTSTQRTLLDKVMCGEDEERVLVFHGVHDEQYVIEERETLTEEDLLERCIDVGTPGSKVRVKLWWRSGGGQSGSSWRYIVGCTVPLPAAPLQVETQAPVQAESPGVMERAFDRIMEDPMTFVAAWEMAAPRLGKGVEGLLESMVCGVVKGYRRALADTPIQPQPQPVYVLPQPQTVELPSHQPAAAAA